MASPTTPQHGRHGAIYRLRPTATASSLTSEACTEVGATAQITDSAKRFLDPNNPPVFTDTGGEQVLRIDYTTGTAYFSGTVTVVTCTGTDSYYPASELTKVGYLTDWSFTTTLELADSSYMGQAWKNNIPGQAGGTGSANAFFIGDDSFFDGIENKELFLLQLFNYDPDQDQTGDHFNAWVWFNGIGDNAAVGDTVKESLDFTIDGIPSFTANA
jgi:hypothetical protein